MMGICENSGNHCQKLTPITFVCILLQYMVWNINKIWIIRDNGDICIVFFWVRSRALVFFSRMTGRMRTHTVYSVYVSPSISLARSHHLLVPCILSLQTQLCVQHKNSRIQTEPIITSDGTRFGWPAPHSQHHGWIELTLNTQCGEWVFVCLCVNAYLRQCIQTYMRIHNWGTVCSIHTLMVTSKDKTVAVFFIWRNEFIFLWLCIAIWLCIYFTSFHLSLSHARTHTRKNKHSHTHIYTRLENQLMFLLFIRLIFSISS